MKIVINKCYGGFGLSPEATLRVWDLGFKEIGTPVAEYYGFKRDKSAKASFEKDKAKWLEYLDGKEVYYPHVFTKDFKYALYAGSLGNRTDPNLIKVVEEMGEKSWGPHAELRVIEIPDGIEWELDDYDGIESVSEVHRSWG